MKHAVPRGSGELEDRQALQRMKFIVVLEVDSNDYETEEEDVQEGTLQVRCVPTNGSMVIIRDLRSWLQSPYEEI